MKNNLSKFLLAPLLLIIVYFSIYAIQTKLIREELIEYVNAHNTEGIVKQEIIRCSYNIFNTEIAYIDLEKSEFVGEDFGIYFFNLNDPFRIKNNNWDKTGIGASDPKNTTFAELKKMVKEDCSQFKQAKGDPSDETINWSYTEYDAELFESESEPEMTEEEAEEYRRKAYEQFEMMDKIRNKEL